MICALINGRFFKSVALDELDKVTNNYNSKVTKLSIIDIGINKMPDFVRYFKNLEYLYIEDSAFEDGTLIKYLTNLKSLNIRNTKIQNLSFIEYLSSLEELTLFKNCLKVLPKNLSKIKTLQNLYIEENIKIFPEEFSSHPNLKSFFLKSNSLVKLPSNFGNFPSLTALMFFCKLETFPNTIHKMQKLEFLDLYNNNIVELPQEICLLKNLKFLHIRKNNLKFLLKSIIKIKKLKVIDIRDNQLIDYYQFINTNKKVYLSGNKFDEFESKNDEKEFYGYDTVDLQVVDKDILYRGRQPSLDAYQFLQRSKGIKTIICLRELGNGFCEFLTTKKIKFNFFIIPFDTNFPKIDPLIELIEIVRQKKYWPIYIHCFTGKDRTGLACAFYRCIINNWTIENSINEMKKMGLHYWRNNLIEFLLRIDFKKFNHLKLNDNINSN